MSALEFKKYFLPVLLCVIIYLPALVKLFLLIKDHGKPNKTKVNIKQLLLYFCVSIIVCGVFIFSLNQVNFLNYKSPISYSKIEEITFSDFRGLEFFRSTFYGNRRYAYIVTDIVVEYDEEEVYAESFFHPAKSYVYNKKAYADGLLTHELYHFRITEVYCRRIKKRIKNLIEYDESKIESIISNESKKERAHQYRYDKDTFHGYVLKNQRKYQKDVDSLLYLLNEYKSPKIIL